MSQYLWLHLFVFLLRSNRYETQKIRTYWVPRFLSLGKKRSVRGVNHTASSSTDIENDWSYTSALHTRVSSHRFSGTLQPLNTFLWIFPRKYFFWRSNHVENADIVSFVPSSKVWASLMRFSWNSLPSVKMSVDILLYVLSQSANKCEKYE